MTPFLKQVALHYFEEGLSEQQCFVFPSKRSEAFFRKYIAECVVGAGIPLRLPRTCTMNDFFYKAAGTRPTDRVYLLVELYECYKALNPKAESLDDFIFWGSVLLSDFSDVDKYLVKPEAIWANVTEFREMQDDFQWLEEKQVEAIEHFSSHFRTGGRFKDAFRQIWDLLLPLYRSFNSRLASKGLAYEGAVYRSLAERLLRSSGDGNRCETPHSARDDGEAVRDVMQECYPGVEKFVFVGLNALNECERLLLRRLHRAGLAEFCWDYSSAWIKDPHNKSSLFLSRNVIELPQSFPLDQEGLQAPNIKVLSLPSCVGQASALPKILSSFGALSLADTAIILPDEAMLVPILNSIPSEIESINVTMGSSLQSGALWSLMHDVAALQLHLRAKDGKWYFYHKYVWSIFSGSLFGSLLTEEEKARVGKIQSEARYYVCEDDFKGDGSGLMELVFSPVVTEATEATIEGINKIEEYQIGLISAIATGIKGSGEMSLELSFCKEFYQAIRRLQNIDLPVLPATYFKLLDQLLVRSSVPFESKALEGLQIMGPLETRALDFKNIIIFGANEGVFPRRNVAASFIPAELRKGFGLPTYEFQDAIWAYYFYRLLQRAETVWLLYDSRTSGLNTGEESRYIKQLEMHFGAKVKRYVSDSQLNSHGSPHDIEKTQADIDKIHSHQLSPTTLENYIACPALFYYQTVRELYEGEEVTETLDAGMVGTVLHNSMQKLYTVPGGILLKSYLEGLLEGTAIPEMVEAEILSALRSFSIEGKNLVFKDIISRHVRSIVSRDIEYLEMHSADFLRILGLELKLSSELFGFRIKGTIDRLDSISDGEIRIVDYKTGKVEEGDFKFEKFSPDYVPNKKPPKDSKAPLDTLAKKIFDEAEQKIPLQLFIYNRLVDASKEYSGSNLKHSIYSPLFLATNPVSDSYFPEPLLEKMGEKLQGLLRELEDPETCFSRKGPTRRPDGVKTLCDDCNFKNICGR